MRKSLLNNFALILIVFCSFFPLSFGEAEASPNLSAVYRLGGLDAELPPIPDMERQKVKGKLRQDFQNVFKRIYTTNPALALEIGRLPEFQDNIDQKELPSLIRFSEIIESASPEQRKALEALLKIGIPEHRRYCTPLQSIFWIIKKQDKSLDKTILGYSLDKILDQAWDFSDQARWNDYETVTDRLNSPELVNYYQRIRLVYESKAGKRDPFEGNAHSLFVSNVGNCYDHSVFGAYFLEKAGYKTSVVGVHPSQPRYHVVCQYEVDGKNYFIDNGRPDKFFRRGIIPKEEYEMYREKENVRKGEGTKDPVYLLQDNHGLVLVYLMDQKEKVASVTAVCKALGLSGHDEKVRKEYLPALTDKGFITKLTYKGWLSDDFGYTINESLCERFKTERYHRPQNAAAKY